MDKNEKKKQKFLAKMSKKFLNEAVKCEFTLNDMIELAIRMSYVMVKFAFIVKMPKDKGEEARDEAATNATLFAMAHYGKMNEKVLRDRGLSYREAKKEIQNVIDKLKNTVIKKDKEE